MILKIHSQDIDFHKLIEYSLNSILIVGKEGDIVYSNKASLELLKLQSREEILYKNLYTFLPESNKDAYKMRLKSVIEKHENSDLMEGKMIRGDGKTIDVELKMAPIQLGEEVYAQVILQDITNRKIAVNLLNAREKLSSLGLIAAGIAHEIKNPLTSVKGFLQLLKESQSHHYLDTMESELEKALATLENLLQVSKPDIMDEPCVAVDLSEELTTLLYLFQEKLYNVKTELDLRDSGKTVMGKRNLLLKAFFNVIKNAIESIPHKGSIRIEHYYKNGRIHIKVSDTGQGVPADKVKLLGTPFFSTKHQGTGLGLTQVYTAIHEHGGNVSVESVVGEGTTFHIELPANT
ncbi:ATP-binding protein [Peribacillus sp. SCS-155]|uniref:ATP-binding protein n=1 Tax=Peribacillus sedimenti TaxID=3115297 RepID=UPI0039068ABA